MTLLRTRYRDSTAQRIIPARVFRKGESGSPAGDPLVDVLASRPELFPPHRIASPMPRQPNRSGLEIWHPVTFGSCSNAIAIIANRRATIEFPFRPGPYFATRTTPMQAIQEAEPAIVHRLANCHLGSLYINRNHSGGPGPFNEARSFKSRLSRVHGMTVLKQNHKVLSRCECSFQTSNNSYRSSTGHSKF